MTKHENLPWSAPDIAVAVVGDIMLDEYLEGKVNRISPEAPVPIHLVSDRFLRPGGAANVALNIHHLGGRAMLLSVCGQDEAGDQVKSILQEQGVDTACIFSEAGRSTVKKTRISANRQQIVRVDSEPLHAIGTSLQSRILEKLAEVTVQAILLSDYGKGLLTAAFISEVIAIGKKKNVPVLVDPKGNDFSRYRGCSVITPNLKEACEALKKEDTQAHRADDLAAELQKKYDLKGVLLTLGADGILFAPDPESKEKSVYLAANAKEVFDVSGAGDTVVATYALAMAAGSSAEYAVTLANLAGGRVVGKWGTQPIYRDELLEELGHLTGQSKGAVFDTRSKIHALPDLLELLKPIKERKRKIVFTNGCFDILHAGHVSYLEAARARGDLLVVGVNSDKSVRSIKGSDRPVIACKHRMRLLASLACIDFVVSFDEDTPEELIGQVVPSVLLKGADWDTSKIVGAEVVKGAGGVVDNIDLVPDLSTTDIIQRVRAGKGVASE